MSKTLETEDWDALFAEISPHRVTIEFENAADKTVFLHWLDSAGEISAMSDLQFEAVQSGRMRKGHEWTEDEQWGVGYTFLYGNPNEMQDLADVERVKVVSFDDGENTDGDEADGDEESE